MKKNAILFSLLSFGVMSVRGDTSDLLLAVAVGNLVGTAAQQSGDVKKQKDLIAENCKKLLETRVCKNCNLVQADLSKADLTRVDLSGSDLSHAVLSEANLSEANLSGANLGIARLRKTNLSGANLSGVNLNRADLDGANLDKANFTGANLDNARMVNVDMSKAEWKNATLTNLFCATANIIPPAGYTCKKPKWYSLDKKLVKN